MNMHWRTAREMPGEQPSRGPHHDADSDTRAVMDWIADHPLGRPNSGRLDVAPPFILDRDFAALCFALAALTLPFALLGFGITVWLLFFE
jgi:hypothetical protein